MVFLKFAKEKSFGRFSALLFVKVKHWTFSLTYFPLLSKWPFPPTLYFSLIFLLVATQYLQNNATVSKSTIFIHFVCPFIFMSFIILCLLSPRCSAENTNSASQPVISRQISLTLIVTHALSGVLNLKIVKLVWPFKWVVRYFSEQMIKCWSWLHF